MSASIAWAAPAAPVVTGPTAIQFAVHPAGFRSLISWDPVPTAVEYRVYNADTLFYVGSVTGTSAAIYGMQNVLYHHYVVAVDAAGELSVPSNIVDIMTSAPVPPVAPTGFSVVSGSVFDLQTSSAPVGDVPVKVPYDPLVVSGDAASLKLLHYTGDAWTDITTSVDTLNHFVYGVTSSFSVFAVMEPPVAVTVPTTISIVGQPTIRMRQPTVLTGQVSPPPPGMVTIVMTRLVGKDWVSAGSVSVAVTDGAFHYDFAPMKRGTWRFVASYPGAVVGATTYLPSTSVFKTVFVK